MQLYMHITTPEVPESSLSRLAPMYSHRDSECIGYLLGYANAWQRHRERQWTAINNPSFRNPQASSMFCCTSQEFLAMFGDGNA